MPSTRKIAPPRARNADNPERRRTGDQQQDLNERQPPAEESFRGQLAVSLRRAHQPGELLRGAFNLLTGRVRLTRKGALNRRLPNLDEWPEPGSRRCRGVLSGVAGTVRLRKSRRPHVRVRIRFWRSAAGRTRWRCSYNLVAGMLGFGFLDRASGSPRAPCTITASPVDSGGVNRDVRNAGAVIAAPNTCQRCDPAGPVRDT